MRVTLGHDLFVEFRSDLFQLLSGADSALQDAISQSHLDARSLRRLLLPDRRDRKAIARFRPAATTSQSAQPSAFPCGDLAQKLHFFPCEARSLIVGQVAAFGCRSQHVDDGIVAIQRCAGHEDSLDTKSLGRKTATPAIDDDTPGDDLDGNTNTSLGDVRLELCTLFRRHPGNAVHFGMKTE